MSRDILGWRKLFGVMGPSTNTVVQPDYDMLRPAGVTNHYSRIFTPDSDAVSNESFRAGISVISGNTMDAVRSVMTCHPDYLVMGMSAITFFGGQKGADDFVAQVGDVSGLGISIGSHSCTAALNAFGGIRRLAVLTPYWPVMNAEVARYFGDMGFSVVRDIALQCRSWTGIAGDAR
jgi:maleate isomerase